MHSLSARTTHIPSSRGSPVYQKPTLQKFGTFRELTRFGFASAADGISILGIGGDGCEVQWGSRTYEIGCPEGGATSS